MKGHRLIWVLVLAVALAGPLFAGGKEAKHAKKHDCTMDTQACLNAMAAKMRARGWVGVEFAKKEGKLIIAKVEPDSPAMAAGIQKGDVLIAFNGVAYIEGNEKKLKAEKKAMAIGKTITYTVVRKGKKKDVDITLAETPDYIVARWIGGHMMEQHATIEVAQK
jgi:predicted metalloprotease with PDZ domain